MDLYGPEDERSVRFFDRKARELLYWSAGEDLLEDYGFTVVPGKVTTSEGSGLVRVELSNLDGFADFLASGRHWAVVAEERTTSRKYRSVVPASAALRKDERFSRWAWCWTEDLLGEQVREWVEHDLERDVSVPTSVVYTAVFPSLVATCVVESGYLSMEDYVYECVKADPGLRTRLEEVGSHA